MTTFEFFIWVLAGFGLTVLLARFVLRLNVANHLVCMRPRPRRASRTGAAGKGAHA